MENTIVKPIRFVDKKEDTTTKKEDNDEKAKLKLNCKYGNLELNLSKLPLIGNFFV